jgi:hypothetical protein
MFSNSSRGAALITISTTGVRITLSKTVLDLESLFKGRVLIRTIRARARGE